jgi:hypothetical protein
VPYVLATGNHDTNYDGSRTSLVSQYFPPHRQGLSGTTFEEGHSENGYRIVTLGGTEYLVLSLEFFPREEVMDWAEDVLHGFRDFRTIIITHAYLYFDGLRYGEPGAEGHQYGVGDGMKHVLGTAPYNATDGEAMFQRLVLPNSQVEFVLSGHVLGKGVAHRSVTRPDGSVVHEVLQNYQMREMGGQAYLRIYEGYGDRVEVSTYSPYLDEWMRDADHQFTLTK